MEVSGYFFFGTFGTADRLGCLGASSITATSPSSSTTEALEAGWNEDPIGPDYAAALAPQYFNWRKRSIYGGTNEIQKNIIAKRVLGL